jgi:hypothetical protein
MNKHLSLALALAAVLAPAAPVFAAEDEAGFKPLMDGKTFNGWKPTAENGDAWTIKDGAFVANGQRSHLYYVGDDKPFKNFHFKAEVMTGTNSNGGIYFHTRYQAEGWPRAGIESQVNISHGDWKKTGSLYDLVNIATPAARDNEWWTQEIIVENRKVTVKVDGRIVLEYVEPLGAQPGKPYERILGEGTFCLQAHDPRSIIRYRNIRVKRL